MTEDGVLRRVFFALWPEGATLARLDAAARDGMAHCGGRRMRSDSLHMTLQFVGAVGPARVARLCLVADRVSMAPFFLTLDRLGYWPHNHILWAGCAATTGPLHQLVAELADGIASDNEHSLSERERFVPHITLLRQARCQTEPVLDAPIVWRVGGFVLAESLLQPAGARYRIMKHWLLQEST